MTSETDRKNGTSIVDGGCPEADAKRWDGRTDGGRFGLKSVAWMVKCFGARTVYGLMGATLPFYMAFRPQQRKAAYAFYRKRLGYGPAEASRAVWKCYWTFGKVVVDKFAFFGGVTKGYVLEAEDGDWGESLFSGSGGAVLASAHVGCLEAVGSLLKQDRKDMLSLVYAGERESILRSRAKALEGSRVRLVPVSDDMSHIFEVSSSLEKGSIVVMTADRAMDNARCIPTRLFGKQVQLPAGAFALAAKMNVPMYTLFVMRTGHKRYRMYLEQIDLEGYRALREVGGETEPVGDIEAMADVYAGRLEEIISTYPEQWFNFYDYFDDLKD